MACCKPDPAAGAAIGVPHDVGGPLINSQTDAIGSGGIHSDLSAPGPQRMPNDAEEVRPRVDVENEVWMWERLAVHETPADDTSLWWDQECPFV
jgi:hypothetical protein